MTVPGSTVDDLCSGCGSREIDADWTHWRRCAHGHRPRYRTLPQLCLDVVGDPPGSSVTMVEMQPARRLQE